MAGNDRVRALGNVVHELLLADDLKSIELFHFVSDFTSCNQGLPFVLETDRVLILFFDGDQSFNRERSLLHYVEAKRVAPFVIEHLFRLQEDLPHSRVEVLDLL